MADITTAWLIGSVEQAGYSLTIDASPETIATGDYYLYDATPARSLLDQVVAAMTSAGVTTPAATLTKSGRTRITAGSSFSITWTDADIRDALGFTANIVSQAAVTAANRPGLLWSPGYPETPTTPAGVASYPSPDTLITSSRTGKTTVFTTNATTDLNEFEWDNVAIDRVWTPSETTGEFKYFWSNVIQPGLRWKLYRDVQEDTTDTTTAAALGTPIGPYKVRRIDPRWYSRGIAASDTVTPIRIEATLVNDT